MLDHFWIGAQICYAVSMSQWAGKGRKPRMEDYLPMMAGKKRRKPTLDQLARAASVALGG